MQTKLISQTGLKVRTNCRLGYFSFGTPITKAQEKNNKCIQQRDDYSWDCFWKGWEQNVRICAGNNNGKELDSCMAFVWGPEDLKTYRSQGGTPYNSALGDKCFNEFYDRYKNQGQAIWDNTAEWKSCLATFP